MAKEHSGRQQKLGKNKVTLVRFHCLYSSSVSADFSVTHIMPIYAYYSIYTHSLCMLELCTLHVGIEVLSQSRSSRKSEKSRSGFKVGENERRHTTFQRQQDKGRQDFIKSYFKANEKFERSRERHGCMPCSHAYELSPNRCSTQTL